MTRFSCLFFFVPVSAALTGYLNQSAFVSRMGVCLEHQNCDFQAPRLAFIPLATNMNSRFLTIPQVGLLALYFPGGVVRQERTSRLLVVSLEKKEKHRVPSG